MTPCKEGEVRDRKSKKCRPRLKPGRKSKKVKPSEVTNMSFLTESKKAGANGKVDVKELIKQGCDINDADKDGKTSLMYLAEQGNKEMIKLFVLNGADVKSLTKKKESVLHFANQNSLECLLSYDVPLHQVSTEHKTALHHFMDMGCIKCVTLLLQRNVKLMEFDEDSDKAPNEIQYAMSIWIRDKNKKALTCMFPYLTQEQLKDSFTEAKHYSEPENNYLPKERKEYTAMVKCIAKAYLARFNKTLQ